MRVVQKEVLHHIRQGLLESALALMDKNNTTFDAAELTDFIEDCLTHYNSLKKAQNVRASIQYQRRAAALTMLREAGSLSGAVIPSVVLPEGYCGKIMLASVEGDLIPERTFLRSGDDWHREILRSFEEEVRDYGFENFQICPKGGAFAEFQPDGTIVLSGSSEEFGRCCAEDAIQLVREAYPDRSVMRNNLQG